MAHIKMDLREVSTDPKDIYVGLADSQPEPKRPTVKYWWAWEMDGFRQEYGAETREELLVLIKDVDKLKNSRKVKI